MQFQHPLTLDQLEQVFGGAIAKATKLKDWYENPRHFWRFMSHLSRGAVFLGIVTCHTEVGSEDAAKGFQPHRLAEMLFRKIILFERNRGQGNLVFHEGFFHAKFLESLIIHECVRKRLVLAVSP